MPAQARPPRTVAEAETARSAHLEKRLQLDAAQVATVLAQQRSPSLVIEVLEMHDERRPDGARHLFALYRADDSLEECLLDAVPCPRHPKWRDIELLHVQLAPDGTVDRTAVTLPFHGPLGPKNGRQTLTPRRLHLVAPSPGAAAIAVVEGVRVYPSVDEGGGHYSKPLWHHGVFVWDGRTGVELELGLLVQGGDEHELAESLARLTPAPSMAVPTVTRVVCEDGCVCRLPTSIEASARELERVGKTRRCNAVSSPLALPPGIALIADDIDGRMPVRDAATAKNALPSELAAVTGLSNELATQWLGQASLVRAGWSFEAAWSAASTQGTQGTSFAVLARDDKFLGCLYAPYLSDRTPRDVARACADEHEQHWYLLEATVDGAQRITATSPVLIGESRPERVLRVAPDHWWVEDLVVSRPSSRRGSLWTSQEARVFSPAEPASHQSLIRLETPCCDRGKDQQTIGWAEPVPSPSGPPRLKLHRIECTRACPCAAPPKSSAEARAMVDARHEDPNPACRPTERWLEAPRGR